MKISQAALLMTTVASSPAIPANEVCISNMAGFVMNWDMTDLVNGEKSANSGNYDIDQTKCMKLEDIAHITEHDLVMPHVHADGGLTHEVSSALIFVKSRTGSVTFSCTGTTLDYSCKLNGQTAK